MATNQAARDGHERMWLYARVIPRRPSGPPRRYTHDPATVTGVASYSDGPKCYILGRLRIVMQPILEFAL